MSPASVLWSLLITGGITVVSVVGGLLVRRWVNVEVLEQHNDVGGFIYGVIGVLYAVVLGFTAVIVWERFAEANQCRKGSQSTRGPIPRRPSVSR